MCCAGCTGAVVISIGFGCCTGSSISIAFVGAGFNNGDVGICIRLITGVPGGGTGTVGAGGDVDLAPRWIGLVDMSIPPKSIPPRGGEGGGVAPIPTEAYLPSEIPGDAFGDATGEIYSSAGFLPSEIGGGAFGDEIGEISSSAARSSPSEISAFGDAIGEISPSSATGESRAGLGDLVCDIVPLATAAGSKCASSISPSGSGDIATPTEGLAPSEIGDIAGTLKWGRSETTFFSKSPNFLVCSSSGMSASGSSVGASSSIVSSSSTASGIGGISGAGVISFGIFPGSSSASTSSSSLFAGANDASTFRQSAERERCWRGTGAGSGANDSSTSRQSLERPRARGTGVGSAGCTTSTGGGGLAISASSAGSSSAASCMALISARDLTAGRFFRAGTNGLIGSSGTRGCLISGSGDGSTGEGSGRSGGFCTGAGFARTGAGFSGAARTGAGARGANVGFGNAGSPAAMRLLFFSAQISSSRCFMVSSRDIIRLTGPAGTEPPMFAARVCSIFLSQSDFALIPSAWVIVGSRCFISEYGWWGLLVGTRLLSEISRGMRILPLSLRCARMCGSSSSRLAWRTSSFFISCARCFIASSRIAVVRCFVPAENSLIFGAGRAGATFLRLA